MSWENYWGPLFRRIFGIRRPQDGGHYNYTSTATTRYRHVDRDRPDEEFYSRRRRTVEDEAIIFPVEDQPIRHHVFPDSPHSNDYGGGSGGGGGATSSWDSDSDSDSGGDSGGGDD